MAFALLLTFVFPLVIALEQEFDVTMISKGVHVDRHFSISTEGPTTAALRRSPELQRRVAPGFQLFETVAKIVDERKRVNDSLACDLHHSVQWVRATKNNIKVRQVGEIDETCNTKLVLNEAAADNKLDPAYVRRVKDIIIDVKEAMFQAQRDIPSIPDKTNPDLNWSTGEYAISDWDLKRSGQTCTSDNLFAYRKYGVWYMRAGMTNNPVDAFLPDWGRQFIDEYIPKDFSDPLRLVHAKYGDKEVYENGTTLLSRWSGKVHLASVGNMAFDDNPALSEALRLNALAVDQAEDAVTPSNIAILALPMVMCLIPVAFIADLNTCAMLWYLVFTDVFSVLPFLIKGIELLDSTSIKRGEVVAYHVGNKTLSQMEMWAAECHGKDSFRVLGIVFVCIAVFAITFGVTLEIVAMAVMRRRRIGKGHEASGPFGMAMFGTTTYAPLGSAMAEERDHRLSAELAREPRYSDEEATWHEAFQGPGAMGDGTGNDHPENDNNDPEGGDASVGPGRRWWVLWRGSSRNPQAREDRDSDARDGVEAGTAISVPHPAASSDEEWEDRTDDAGQATSALGAYSVQK